MREAGIQATFLFLRTPALSEVQEVIEYADIKPGDEIPFFLDYGALLSVMTSPYVYKKYLHANAGKHDSSHSSNKTPA